MNKSKAVIPTQSDIERAKLAALNGEVTDKDRIDALITLFGGNYAFPPTWFVMELFQNGRVGLDAFLSANPSLNPRNK